MAEAKLNSAEGASGLIPLLNKEIEEKFQSLLETKHLYQKVEVDWRKVIAGLQEMVHPSHHTQFFQNILGVDKMAFVPVTQVRIVQPQGNLGQVPLVLLLKNATMFCRKCDRREAYRPIWYKDLSADLRQVLQSGLIRHLPVPESLQDFALVYQCQSCEGVPETLVVRREGWRPSALTGGPLWRL